jgi:hypothetical protein
VENTSYLAHADPPIHGKAFITKVNGVHLDRFGMGREPKMFDDPVGFADLLFSREDLSAPATIETCSCGQTHKHTVQLQWTPEMEAPVPHLDEPAFAHLDYEQFGSVTVTPLSQNVAAQLMQMGRIDLLAYLVDPNPEAALIITDVDMSGDTNVLPGSIIAKMNGHKVNTLAQLREHFTDVHDVNVTCGMDTGEHASGGMGGGFGADPLAAILNHARAGRAHVKPMAHKLKKGATVSAWVLETTEGEDLVQPYETTLEEQRSMVSEGARPLTKGVRAAIKAHIAAEEKQSEKAEAEGDDGETEGEGEGGTNAPGGLDLLGLFNILGGGEDENKTTTEGDGEGETESEGGEPEGETGGHKKKHVPPPLEGSDEVQEKGHKKKKGKHDPPLSDPAEEEAGEAVKGAEEGEETADMAAALTAAATRVARKLALAELLAKVPSVPVEERKFVRRGGKPVNW